VTPAALQQARAASCGDFQGALTRFFAEIQAAMEDLHPDDDACGPGRGGAAPGGPGSPDGPSSTDGGRHSRRSRGDNGGGGGGGGGGGAATAGGTVISGSGGGGRGTSGGGGGGVDSGGQGAPGAGACSHWRAPRSCPGESQGDAAARASAARARLAGLGRELLTFTSLGVG
jgi:hypothetical protein